MSKPILCLDFDGVIHSYSSGWKGAVVIPDPPVTGALKFIAEAMEHFTVAIYSSRSHQPGGIKAMIQWLGRWSVDPDCGLPGDFDHGAWGALQWPQEKPAAFIGIDDRVLTFNGTWPSFETLKGFKPWNKRDFGATAQFPQGKLDGSDEGELRMGVAYDKLNGVVRVQFGKPVAWLGLPPPEARALAALLLKAAG